MSSPDPTEKKFAALADALRQMEARQSVFIPPAVDEAILREARRRFEKPRRQGWNFPFLREIAAGMAIVALMIFLGRPAYHGAHFAREDINLDGRIDILDAMALAQEIAGAKTSAAHDQNGDGRVDAEDVNLIAAASVRLEPKEGI